MISTLLHEVPGNIAVPMLSFVLGLVALAPMRDRLGVRGYAVMAYPVGLVGWGFVPVASTAIGSVTRWSVIVPVLACYVLAVALLGRWASRATTTAVRARFPITKWPVAPHVLAVALIATYVLYRMGYSIHTADSWSNYQMFGQILADSGRLNVGIISNRGLILPALHAASTFIGGSWTYTIYPLMSLNVVALLAFALSDSPFGALSRAWRVACVSVSLLALVTTAPYILHSFYVHSHMASSLGLLVAVIGLWRAYGSDAALGDGGHADETAARLSWLVIAALGTVLFAWARPDGIAYMFVLFVVFALAALRATPDGPVSVAEIAAYFSPVAVALGSLYAVLFSEYGLYEAPERLGGTSAAGILLVAAATPVLIRIVSSRPWWRREFGSPRGMLWIATANTALLLGVYTFDSERFVTAGANWVQNLVIEGGWNHMWVFVAVVLIGSLLLPEALRNDRWGRLLAYAVFQFFGIALLVHALTHPGRLGWSDSLNRVTFHVMPLVFWLGAVLVVGTIRLLRNGAVVSDGTG